MATTIVDQITGGGETVAQKAPCRLATTGNITLSGHQTVDGVMTNDSEPRTLVRANTDPKENGIWIASAGAWVRARDFDSNRDVTKGTLVIVTDGSTLAGKEFQLTSANPITIGTSNIAWTESLSSDAGSAAAAAEAARDIAIAKADLTAADAIATAADRIQSGLDATGTAADRVQTGLDATATDADRIQTGLDATATGGDAIATAADRVQTGLDKVATAADRVQTGLDAASAIASAATAANSVAALPFNFSTTTTDADPGAGTFRLNNADPALATKAFIDNVDANGVTVTALLDAWDDASAAVKGVLTIRAKANSAIVRVYNVSSTVVDDTGYRDVTLTYVGGAGTLTAAMPCWLIFSRSGNDGAGTGDVVGPASVTDDLPAIFDGTTGKLIKQKTYAAFKTLLALVKGDVGLGNVDNTSNTTERAAAATLANKTLTAPAINDQVATGFTGHAIAGLIKGLTLSNNGTDATNDIDIAIGSAASIDAVPVLMTLPGALTKRLDAAWAVGNNQGGRMSAAAIADTTYHMFLIRRPDTGVVDVGFDVSATVPTMPANFTQYRRIGSIIRTAGAIVLFTQTGDTFRRAPVTDRSSVAAAASALLTLSVPSGINCFPILIMNLSLNASDTVYNQLGSASVGSAEHIVHLLTTGAGDDVAQLVSIIEPIFVTNTSAQLYFACIISAGAPTGNSLSTVGWIDTRGRDA